MTGHSRTPLSPEERELADLLARLGPHGEPSPALDARILSAAQVPAAPLARSPGKKPRWLVPVGLAASALLAVGIAWQLRPVESARSPLPHMAPSASQAPADSAASAMEEAAEAPQAAADVSAPVDTQAPVSPAASQAATSSLPASDAYRANTEPHPAHATPKAVPLPPASASVRPPASNVLTTPRTVAPPAAAAPSAPVFAPAPQAEAPMAITPPAAKSLADDASATDHLDRPGFVATPHTKAAIDAQREKDRSERIREMTQSQTYTRTLSPLTPQAEPASSAQDKASSQPLHISKSGNSNTRNALRRTDLQLPVSQDARLPPEEWLERIRLRRDLGDRASAADSLSRFRQNHPFQKIPDDLRELLTE